MVDNGGRVAGGGRRDGSEGMVTGGVGGGLLFMDSDEGLEGDNCVVSLSCGWPCISIIDVAVLLAEETLLIATEDDVVAGFSPRFNFNSTRRSPT